MSNQEVRFSSEKERFYCDEGLFTGVFQREHEGLVRGVFQVCEGLMWGMSREYNAKSQLTKVSSYEDVLHGYKIEYFAFGEVFAVYVEGEVVEIVKSVNMPRTLEESKKSNSQIEMLRQRERDVQIKHCESSDFVSFYLEQERLSSKVISSSKLNQVQKIAGADVAYNEQEQRMVGALVVLDAETLEVLDQATHEMEITFPYVPGLFSFREVPALLEAYEKLTVQPDLIVCDGHGVAHPKGAGMASHLGVELGVPTVGCAKSRLIGGYDEVGEKRGSSSSLMLGDKEIGRVLRTRDGVKPMFVSVGHLVNLDTACEWVLKLCPRYRQPETTRKADALVREVMKERTKIGYPEE